MDNVCHTLVGAAIGHTGLKRRTRFAQGALMVAANVPDVDVLVFLTDVPSVAFRRGWTHGVVAQVLLPLTVVAVFALANRLRPPRAGDETPPFRAWWILLLACIGVVSHVLLDLLNNYGVRLLTPIDWRWFYGDAVFIIDPWLWLTLGLGVWLARRRHSAVPARWAVALALSYILAIVWSTRAAEELVLEQWGREQQAAPRALMVGPRPVTPLTRDVIVDAGTTYFWGTFDWWTGSVTWDEQRLPKNDQLPHIAVARGDPAVRGFLVWSRFPFWRTEPVAGGTRVTVGDARFMNGARGFSRSVVVPDSAIP
jgi:inner membrane protein